ncbi:hypothetical protein CC78DRAFT_580480 [Lojkania enalia]|uniref:Uncharacterized protein n=1 Tax=Lojkania enalia TaxID=147567 RepID=A0A9P4KE32_9PLEO|nr:hypothetical protein CC78DRAFT_580480 [Didymosphaeria enalia]
MTMLFAFPSISKDKVVDTYRRSAVAGHGTRPSSSGAAMAPPHAESLPGATVGRPLDGFVLLTQLMLISSCARTTLPLPPAFHLLSSPFLPVLLLCSLPSFPFSPTWTLSPSLLSSLTSTPTTGHYFHPPPPGSFSVNRLHLDRHRPARNASLGQPLNESQLASSAMVPAMYIHTGYWIWG